MKKYVLLVSLLSIGLFASAQGLMGPEYYTREAILQRKIASQQFKATQQTMNTSLTVEIPIKKQYFLSSEHHNSNFSDSALYRTWRNIPTYTSTVGCKAYALSNEWLVAGAACLWNGRHTVNIDGKIYDTGLTEVNLNYEGGMNPENVTSGIVKIDGKSVFTIMYIQSRYTQLPHLI